MKAQSRFFGGIFIGAGVLLAASGRNLAAWQDSVTFCEKVFFRNRE
jgi:hypothetical protein